MATIIFVLVTLIVGAFIFYRIFAPIFFMEKKVNYGHKIKKDEPEKD